MIKKINKKAIVLPFFTIVLLVGSFFILQKFKQMEPIWASLAPKTLTREKLVKVACVGDSITQGSEEAQANKETYPDVLSGYLGNRYIVKNFGASGHSAQSGLNYSYNKHENFVLSQEFKPDIVIIKLGTNDTITNNWKNKKIFIEEYEKLIDCYAKLDSNPQIFLVTPAKAFSIKNKKIDFTDKNKKLQEVRSAIIAFGKEKNYQVIDMYKAIESHPEFFLEDGLHPNKEGAKFIAKTIYNEIDWT